MKITPNMLKLFWVAVRKLGLSDATVRTALVQMAGVTSSKELDRAGFDAMMGFFQYCGLDPVTPQGQDYG
ncbi:hypothetical protein [Pseudaestuariivita sp.]|uniref:hypothetical protein n=1 Tax=Pseudaestuariivita sp. TaxID=2211669 RepID=UPI0040587439